MFKSSTQKPAFDQFSMITIIRLFFFCLLNLLYDSTYQI